MGAAIRWWLRLQRHALELARVTRWLNRPIGIDGLGGHRETGLEGRLSG